MNPYEQMTDAELTQAIGQRLGYRIVAMPTSFSVSGQQTSHYLLSPGGVRIGKGKWFPETCWGDLPHWTSDLNEAIQLAQQIASSHYLGLSVYKDNWTVAVLDDVYSAPTPARAICIAWLAVTDELAGNNNRTSEQGVIAGE